MVVPLPWPAKGRCLSSYLGTHWSAIGDIVPQFPSNRVAWDAITLARVNKPAMAMIRFIVWLLVEL